MGISCCQHLRWLFFPLLRLWIIERTTLGTVVKRVFVMDTSAVEVADFFFVFISFNLNNFGSRFFFFSRQQKIPPPIEFFFFLFLKNLYFFFFQSRRFFSYLCLYLFLPKYKVWHRIVLVQSPEIKSEQNKGNAKVFFTVKSEGTAICCRRKFSYHKISKGSLFDFFIRKWFDVTLFSRKK